MVRIRDHVYVVMSSGVVPRVFEEWQHLEEVLREVYNGKVYRRRGATEGGRGDGGSRGGRGGGRGGGGWYGCSDKGLIVVYFMLMFEYYG